MTFKSSGIPWINVDEHQQSHLAMKLFSIYTINAIKTLIVCEDVGIYVCVCDTLCVYVIARICTGGINNNARYCICKWKRKKMSSFTRQTDGKDELNSIENIRMQFI